MDETFNDDPVEFEYRTGDGKVTQIETLEVMEYGDAKDWIYCLWLNDSCKQIQRALFLLSVQSQ